MDSPHCMNYLGDHRMAFAHAARDTSHHGKMLPEGEELSAVIVWTDKCCAKRCSHIARQHNTVAALANAANSYCHRFPLTLLAFSAAVRRGGKASL